jgi:hypothetical protein
MWIHENFGHECGSVVNNSVRLKFKCYGCINRSNSKDLKFGSKLPRNGCCKVKSQDI